MIKKIKKILLPLACALVLLPAMALTACFAGHPTGGDNNLPPAPSAYAIRVGETSGGIVTADRESAREGETVTLTVSPDDGYALRQDSLKVNGTAIYASEEPTYSFAMPAADVTITAVFALHDDVYTFTPNADGSGYIVTGTKYDSTYVNVDIPATHEGLPVVEIAAQAFAECFNLQSLVIPDTVRTVGREAFKRCSFLENVTLSGGIETVADGAFADCESLVFLTLPDSVTEIGRQAFAGCEKLTRVTIGRGVKSIGDQAFYGCLRLIEIYNLSALDLRVRNTESTRIGLTLTENIYTADSGASKLSADGDFIVYDGDKDKILMGYTGDSVEIELPEDITVINYSAFYRESELVKITIPAGVWRIAGGAFFACFKLIEIRNLSSLEITAGETMNGEVALYAKNVYKDAGGSKLSNIDDYIVYTDGGVKTLVSYTGNEIALTIPNGITAIGNSAFINCVELRDIAIPDSVTVIGSSAFANCAKLQTFIVPDSVTAIGDDVFFGCYSLTDFDFGSGVKSIGQKTFSLCTNLTSIAIPENIVRIEKDAFVYCTRLTGVTFADTVGWRMEQSSGEGTPLDVSDPAANAERLTDELTRAAWYKK